MKTKLSQNIFALSFLALTLLLSACQAALPVEAAAAEPPAAKPAVASLPAAQPTAAAAPTLQPTQAPAALLPSVSVSDQSVDGDQVIVSLAVSPGPGWIVIHADNGGKPGAVLGYAPLMEGENRDVKVVIDDSEATPILYAMLHTDAAAPGVYEFPGEDKPVMLDGQMVSPAFQVTGGSGKNSSDDSSSSSISSGSSISTSASSASSPSSSSPAVVEDNPNRAADDNPGASSGKNGSKSGSNSKHDGSDD